MNASRRRYCCCIPCLPRIRSTTRKSDSTALTFAYSNCDLPSLSEMDSGTTPISPSCDSSVVRLSIDRIHTSAKLLLDQHPKVFLKPTGTNLAKNGFKQDRSDTPTLDYNGIPVIHSDYYDRAVKYWPLKTSPQGIADKYAQWIADCMNYLAQKAPELQFSAFWSQDPTDSYIEISLRKTSPVFASTKYTTVHY